MKIGERAAGILIHRLHTFFHTVVFIFAFSRRLPVFGRGFVVFWLFHASVERILPFRASRRAVDTQQNI